MKVFWLLVAACSCALAETSGPALRVISGVVTDASTAPVANARVVLTERVSGTRRVTESNNLGLYRFGSLPSTEFVLEASANGFGSAEPQQIRLSTAGAQVDIRLDIARIVSQVQVTAAAVAQTVEQQSKALDIVDSAQMARRAEFSVAEALRTVPGIRVAQLGGPGSLTRVLTRGMRAIDTSFLIDGFRLRDAASPQGDVTAFIGDLLVSDVDRLEVLRGSGSSLYGTHATAGVVNIITDQGGGRLRGDLSTEGGGLGLFRGTARASGSVLQDRLRFSGGVTHLNVTQGVDEDDRARNSTLHGFAQYQLAPRTTASVRLLLADTFAGLNDSPFLNVSGNLVPAPNDPDQRRSALTNTVLTQLRHIFTPWVSVQASYSGVGTKRDNRDGPAGVRFEPAFNNSNRFDGRIDTVQARTDLSLGRHHLFTGGYEWERESFDNLSRDQNPNPASQTNARLRIDQSSHAGFAQLQGRYLNDRLQVQISGRLQRFDLRTPRFSGNSTLYSQATLATPPDARTGDVSAAYTIASTTTKLRAHAGNGYRAPALYERFGASFFGGSFSGYGDPRLAPERLLAFDGGVDQYLAKSRVRVSATYFYTYIQEQIIFDFSGLIVPATDPFGRFGGYRNTRGGIARGVEVSVEATPTRTLTVQGAYTFAKALDRVSQYGNTVLRSPRISDHVFTATASQRLGRRLDVTFDLFANSPYLFPLSGRAYQFDGPIRGDLVVGWTKPFGDTHSLRLFTRVENVFNRKFYEEGFPTPRAWAVAGIKWMF
ncbi:MAG: TonB-dependent receptor plug domain-containing protein [Bryobacteraceae bacterium]|nr:TonB-dependent receptor plug domain-containing protein [Bryobacteraceae bacterium]